MLEGVIIIIIFLKDFLDESKRLYERRYVMGRS